MIIVEHNVETNEVIEREMSDKEFEQYQIDNVAFLAEQAAKEEVKAQRQVLLNRLGITEDEAKLLLS